LCLLYVVIYFVLDASFAFVVLDLVFQYLTKRLVGKNVSNMTYFVLCGTFNLSWVNQSLAYGLQVVFYTFMMLVCWMPTGWLRMLHMIHIVSCALTNLLMFCSFISLTNHLYTTVQV